MSEFDALTKWWRSFGKTKTRVAAGDVHGAADTIQALQFEVAWLKTQMAGLVDYEAEISERLTAACVERDRLQGENFRLRSAMEARLTYHGLRGQCPCVDCSEIRSALEAKP